MPLAAACRRAKGLILGQEAERAGRVSFASETTGFPEFMTLHRNYKESIVSSDGAHLRT